MRQPIVGSILLLSFCRLVRADAAIDRPVAPTMSLSSLSTLMQQGQIVIPQRSASPIYSFPLNSPPINGFVPQVIVGLTTQQNRNDYFAVADSFSAGSPGTRTTFPGGGTPYYVSAIFDTGSQADIFTYNDSYGPSGFFIDNGLYDRSGVNQQEIVGASGSEFADISDGLGVYITGINNAGVSNGSITVNAGTTMKGDWNFSVLTSEFGSALPNIVGSPILAHYQAKIQNSQTRHIDVGTTTYRTPTVSLQAQNTAIPSGFVKLTLTPTDSPPPADPFFFPDFSQTNWANDPISPSSWTSLTAKATATHNGTAGSQDFLFDTGAQVSVISSDTAAACGITASTPPDFTVEVAGVGGTTSQVPGYYINSLSILTTGVGGGTITFTHVPVLMLDVADPRSGGTGYIPGILGMNLFTDRDLVINGGNTSLWVGIGPQITPQWTFNGSGTWSDDTKWSLGSPNDVDAVANFTSAITAAATITVDSSGFTVGQINFDNANRYTIAGPGTITMAAMSLGAAAINVVSGSHTISAPLAFNGNTTISVAPSGGSLTLSGDMNSGTAVLTKTGAGTLALKHVRAGALNITAGNVVTLANGTTTGTSHVSTLTLNGGTTPTVKFDLNNNAMVIDYTGSSPTSTIRQQIKAAYGTGSWTGNGITSSAAASQAGAARKTAVGYAEDSAVGSPTSFLGQPADTTSILVRYVYYGDANLDKTVDLTDFTFLAQSFNGSNKFWVNGDFNYDGNVDLTDFTLLASNFNQTLPDEPLGSTIPEPGAVLLIGATCLAATRRSR